MATGQAAIAVAAADGQGSSVEVHDTVAAQVDPCYAPRDPTDEERLQEEAAERPRVKSARAPGKPTAADWAAHLPLHEPYRSW